MVALNIILFPLVHMSKMWWFFQKYLTNPELTSIASVLYAEQGKVNGRGEIPTPALHVSTPSLVEAVGCNGRGIYFHSPVACHSAECMQGSLGQRPWPIIPRPLALPTFASLLGSRLQRPWHYAHSIVGCLLFIFSDFGM